ncbi:hypothetical protein [Flavobacterium sp. 1355]|uniref:hypothetical protein n=1 Tax=Flavobacterium sp. 1355 TaxID=2806571 RepID=UPI001AEA71F0|nr:hypothetical protein [Flavobacterium sp. 1355]MBP1224586.1 hypothetical protein [Flavobacterium sp. 1355]
MQKINVLKILIVALTNVLALINFNKNDFQKRHEQTESKQIKISVEEKLESIASFKIL